MKVTCEMDTDTMTIMLRDERTKESGEVRPGVRDTRLIGPAPPPESPTGP
ncbi:MAG TPA: hypothetical protein VGS20_00165 [Candidatus Acidoferrales bacterium]|nr:hypothetical protein [Candidatus Acidoferrales bacterium]